MKLLKGERIVLEHSPFGSLRKVTLTNKRLTIQKKKGLYFSFWVIEEEFPLGNIKEAYIKTASISGTSSLWLKLKDGKLIQVPTELEAADMNKDYALQIKKMNDKWAKVINKHLNKNRVRTAKKRHKQTS
jgi:hypothetical protein